MAYYRNKKTIRDRARGAHRRNQENKAARAEWSREVKASAGSRNTKAIEFPSHTCNGKKTRALRGEK